MITVQILEDTDTIRMDDWCRPLDFVSMGGGISDHYSFESCYTGAPENNVQWVRVREVIGECWDQKPLGSLNRRLQTKFEVVRGDLPPSHTMKSRRELEAEQEAKDALKDNTPLTFGKHKGKTINYLIDYDPEYVLWLQEKIPTLVSKTADRKLKNAF